MGDLRASIIRMGVSEGNVGDKVRKRHDKIRRAAALVSNQCWYSFQVSIIFSGEVGDRISGPQPVGDDKRVQIPWAGRSGK